jgi:NitT/TauT family transport system ATP-binding protein
MKMNIQKSSSTVEIDGVSKIFRTRNKVFRAIERIDLNVQQNEFVSIVGTSGCGKSTLLNMVGGLDEPTTGEIRINGTRVTSPGRDRGFVFQSYSLFEWMTVRGNILFALEKSNIPKSEKRELTDHFIKAVGLVGFEDAYPRQLSGGMKQRVAIARSLVYKPSILLMDEPFGALDAQTRGMMQELLLNVWEEHRVTVLFVTHDVDEAIFLADRVIVLGSRPGRVKKELKIDLGRPRSFDIVTSPKFADYKREILTDIREETLKVMAFENAQPSGR